MIRRYSELRKLLSFEDRYGYLRLKGIVGKDTFGYDRYINQSFYHSTEWRHVRDEIIVRDNGCDLGIPGYEIHSKILIHHMNPLMLKNLTEGDPDIINPDFLVCTSFRTHQAIHYGDKSLLPSIPIQRKPNDTKLW